MFKQVLQKCEFADEDMVVQSGRLLHGMAYVALTTMLDVEDDIGSRDIFSQLISVCAMLMTIARGIKLQLCRQI